MSRPMIQNEGTDYVVIDVANNSTTVVNGAGRVYGIWVNTQLSNHTCPIEDGGTAVITLPAELSAGVYRDYPGIAFNSTLTVNPNDAASGNFTLFYTTSKVGGSKVYPSAGSLTITETTPSPDKIISAGAPDALAISSDVIVEFP